MTIPSAAFRMACQLVSSLTGILPTFDDLANGSDEQFNLCLTASRELAATDTSIGNCNSHLYRMSFSSEKKTTLEGEIDPSRNIRHPFTNPEPECVSYTEPAARRKYMNTLQNGRPSSIASEH